MFVAVFVDQHKVKRACGSGKTQEQAIANAQKQADEYKTTRPDLQLKLGEVKRVDER